MGGESLKKEKYIETIKTEKNIRTASRKLFITFPNYILQNNEDIQYDITNKISEYFNIPLYQIKIVGSSQLGYSLIKKTEFVEGLSDLDISIISKDLFVNYLELTNKITNSFTDLTKFRDGNDKSFYKYISKGIFRPDLMPNCDKKREWFNFFNNLSNDYLSLFKSINAGIFISEELFILKQEIMLNRENGGI